VGERELATLVQGPYAKLPTSNMGKDDMKPTKKTKLVIGLVLAIIVLGVLFKDTLDSKLAYDEATITTGCVIEFCIGHNKADAMETVKIVLAKGSAELRYKNRNFPVTHSPDDMSHEELLNDDLWTLSVKKKFGFGRNYYLYFDGGVIVRIDVAKYGPLYFDF